MDEDFEVLKNIIGEFKESGGSTIPLLQAIQERFGHIPEEAFQLIEDVVGTPSSTTYGVATFYAQFRLDPVGKHTIKVCDGTACHVKGSETVLNAMKDRGGGGMSWLLLPSASYDDRRYHIRTAHHREDEKGNRILQGR